MEAIVKSPEGLAGFGPIAKAQVVFGERHAQQLLARLIAARCHLIHKRFKKLHRLLQLVCPVSENSAIKLRLIRWQICKLRLHANVLVIGEQVLHARFAIESAAGSRLRLRTRARRLCTGAELLRCS